MRLCVRAPQSHKYAVHAHVWGSHAGHAVGHQHYGVCRLVFLISIIFNLMVCFFAASWCCLSLQNDMESLEPISGMPPGMYHRYGVLDDDMEDEEEDSTEHAGDFGSGTSNSRSGEAELETVTFSQMLAEELGGELGGLDVHDGAAAAEGGAAVGVQGEGGQAADSGAAGQGNWSLMAHPGELFCELVYAGKDCRHACACTAWTMPAGEG